MSLYNETGGRPIPPTPVVGCVGLVRDVTRHPVALAARRRVCLLRGEGAALVRFVWENAARFSLAHDVSDGGLALALTEAAAWSGIDAPPCDLEEASGVIVALAPGEDIDWPEVVELGHVR